MIGHNSGNGLVRACFISLQIWHSFVVTLLFDVYFYLASVTIPGFRARLSNFLAQYSHGKSCAGEPYLENQFTTTTSFPGFSPTHERDPGKRWSRVSQILGDYKKKHGGRGCQVRSLSVLSLPRHEDYML